MPGPNMPAGNRVSTTPMPFQQTSRYDNSNAMTTFRAGVVALLGYVPVLRGESVGGQWAANLLLQEMPRPLANAVVCNVQAWFVPDSAHPRFSGWDEFVHSYQMQPIKADGQSDRNAPGFRRAIGAPNLALVQASDHYKTLGLHIASGSTCDVLFDAYTLVYNFRLEAHSSKLTKRAYFNTSVAASCAFARAFWPANRFTRVVPDYERALVVGQMGLDIMAGQLPVSGIESFGTDPADADATTSPVGAQINQVVSSRSRTVVSSTSGPSTGLVVSVANTPDGPISEIFAEMAGQTVVTSLQDIDKARVTQAMAKARQAYAGIDGSGYLGENTILAELMQGLPVQDLDYRRPWLLGSQITQFVFQEQTASDGASLGESITRGHASVRVPLNVPKQNSGGVIIITCEVLPERIYERQADPFLGILSPEHLPQADRDVLRVEPVDPVTNGRLDVLHANPSAVYGYEPMNDKWNRDFTRLGGAFFQDTPGTTDFDETRAVLWVPEIVNPTFTDTHYLAPADFPHNVFSDAESWAVQAHIRHNCVLLGLTQFGDVLRENNAEFAATEV